MRAYLAVALCAALLAILVLPAPPLDRASAPPTWVDLVAPLEPGRAVAQGYVLYSPRRGEEHDVVFLARRDEAGDGAPGAVEVEIHVLDHGRWKDVAQTASYDIGYEAAPHSTAPEADCEAVTQTLARAVARNDRGFGPVDGIALEPTTGSGAPPRWQINLTGARGACAGFLALAAVAVLARRRRGTLVACAVVGLAALAVRLPSLGVPFVHDQDVQRLLTAALPFRHMLRSIVDDERRPPLYFLLLHATEWFGQAESTVRVPAVLCGALLAPAILWASALLRGKIDLRAVAAALVVAASPPFIARSREVSELPFYALLSIFAVASTSRMGARPSRRVGAVVVASHAGLMWTSYLAPFTIAGEILGLVATRALTRPGARAIGAGVAIGSPGVMMAAATFFRDRHARQVAHEYPGLAWGEWTPGRMLSEIAKLGTDGLGVPVVACVLCVALYAAARRDAAPTAALAALLGTVAGITILVPVARMQPYYLFGVLALAPLALATASLATSRLLDLSIGSVLAAAFSLFVVRSLGQTRSLYVADSAAFGPRFVQRAIGRPETTLAVVAHYDGTLMAYYVARAYGKRVTWQDAWASPLGGEVAGTPVRIAGLAMSHDVDAATDRRAADRLGAIVRDRPALVVQRFDFRLPALDTLLGRCEVLESAPEARLLRCAAPRRQPAAGGAP